MLKFKWEIGFKENVRTQLGYRLKSCIGRGGGGEVYGVEPALSEAKG